MSWAWQDDAAWVACSPAARVHAEAWCANADAQYAALATSAAQQPLTALAAQPETIAACAEVAGRLRRVSDRLVVIGTGGASLGSRTLCALSDNPSRIRFLENCDPTSLEVFFTFPKKSTSWLIISKSGETVETLAATLALLGHYAGNEAELRARLVVLTSEHDSTLSAIADANDWQRFTHPATLGGRYSVFSAVGMIPAFYAGLPVEKMLQAAATSLQHGLQQKDANLLPHAAWLAANLHEKPMQLLMAYADPLRAATQWYKQLWAESLGKQGKGGTPVTAIGAIDQHSQLQLYLDGPRDKLVTLWLPDWRGYGAALPSVAVAGAAYLQGRTMGDVMYATAEATVQTLRKAGVPHRVLRGVLSPESLCAWMARQMLETLLVAQLIGVDPYSQPAVEDGKTLTRAALANGV